MLLLTNAMLILSTCSFGCNIQLNGKTDRDHNRWVDLSTFNVYDINQRVVYHFSGNSMLSINDSLDQLYSGYLDGTIPTDTGYTTQMKISIQFGYSSSNGFADFTDTSISYYSRDGFLPIYTIDYIYSVASGYTLADEYGNCGVSVSYNLVNAINIANISFPFSLDVYSGEDSVDLKSIQSYSVLSSYNVLCANRLNVGTRVPQLREFGTHSSPSSVSLHCVTYDAQFYFDNFVPLLNSDNTYQEGYDTGYSSGYDAGNSSGYQTGFDDARAIYEEQDAIVTSIFDGILGIGLLPVEFLMSIFNFEILGINFTHIISALLSIMVLVILLRIVLGGKGGEK